MVPPIWLSPEMQTALFVLPGRPFVLGGAIPQGASPGCEARRPEGTGRLASCINRS